MNRDEEFGFFDLAQLVWRYRIVVILITSLCVGIAAVYTFVEESWYRADVLLAPAEQQSGSALAAEFGGLAGLAGITVGGPGDYTAIAVLKSRDFTGAFIEENDLLPTLMNGRQGDEAVDIRDAVAFFDREVRKVEEDKTTGMVTVVVEWTDPEVAAEWANRLVMRLNSVMRERALRDAQENVDYLSKELSATHFVGLQQSISRLLERELQKLMLARGNEQFAFTIIDSAQIARKPVRPNAVLIVGLALIIGCVISLFSILFWQGLRSGRVSSSVR